MQIICISFQTDNHASTSSLNFAGQMLILMPNQQCQTTEGNANILKTKPSINVVLDMPPNSVCSLSVRLIRLSLQV